MGRLNNLMPELMDVLRRFPVAALCCVLAFVLRVLNNTSFDRGLVEPDTLGLMAAFLAGGAVHLFAESRKWAVLPSVLLAAVAAGVVPHGHCPGIEVPVRH